MVRDGCDSGLDRPREELGKGKCLAGVSAQRSRLGGVQVGEDSLVESQICPAGEETENRKPQRSAREERRKRQDEDDADIDDGESGYSERQDAAEERDGMRGDQLTEGDEEGYLDRNRASNGRQTRDMLAYRGVSWAVYAGYVRPALVARQSKEEDHDAKSEHVGGQRHQGHKLGQVGRRPSSLKVSAAIEQGQATYRQGEDITLDQRRCEERPGINERQLRDQRQVGDDDF